MSGRTTDRPSFSWSTISTAPLDGTLVRVAWRVSMRLHDHGPVLASWRTYHPNAAGKPCWRGVDGAKLGDPTHWSPVPLLPGEADGEAMPCEFAIADRCCVRKRQHKGRHESADGMWWDAEMQRWQPKRRRGP